MRKVFFSSGPNRPLAPSASVQDMSMRKIGQRSRPEDRAHGYRSHGEQRHLYSVSINTQKSKARILKIPRWNRKLVYRLISFVPFSGI